MTESTSYFQRLSENVFRPTEHVSGGWKIDEQHIAPSIGLLAHLIEKNHRERGGTLHLSSLHYDILGVLPLEAVETNIKVLRPGKTIELVEATLSHNGRAALILRAWLLQNYETADLAGTDYPSMPPLEETPAYDFAAFWPGGLIASIDTKQIAEHPGRAKTWARPTLQLLDTEEASTTARFVGIADIANGTTPRANPHEVLFPNLDLNLNIFRTPEGAWLGYDTSVSFGPTGIGLTHTILHDTAGPFATLAQTTTLRKVAQ